MEEYTEMEAYRHLLEVTENIIYSMDVEQEILLKYQSLKKTVISRISRDTTNSLLLTAYKDLFNQMLVTISAFEQEIEKQMDRAAYNQVVLDTNKKMDKIAVELAKAEPPHAKLRLLYQEEVNNFRYIYEQLDNKFENMGLMIEVHKKMHEIICQASRSENNRMKKEKDYKDLVAELTQEVEMVQNGKEFLNQHQICEKNLRTYKMASKKLLGLLFNK